MIRPSGTVTTTVMKAEYKTKGGRLRLDIQYGLNFKNRRCRAYYGLKLWGLWIRVYWNRGAFDVAVSWDRGGTL